MKEQGTDVHKRESKRVNQPHMAYIIDSLSVALERIFLILDFRTRVSVSHQHQHQSSHLPELIK